MPNQTIKLDQIAKLAGVSRTTASYVINGKAIQHRISETTQKKVMAIVQQYNYQPNRAAAILRAGQSFSVGLIIPDLISNRYAHLASMLEHKTRERGLQLLISCSDDNDETEKIVASNLLNRHVDALLVATSLNSGDHFYQQIQSQGTPVIGIDRSMQSPEFATVESEIRESTRKLLDTLTNNSPITLGLIGAKPELEATQNLEHAVRETLSGTGSRLEVIYGNNSTSEQGFELAQFWLKKTPQPDVLVITSYELLEGFLECLMHLPEARRNQLLTNTHIITLDNSRILDFLPVRITSLGQQYELIASKALELAQEAMKGSYQPGSYLIPPQLKIRH